jgi:antidote-toxin recognition MazE-like antitoxin
MQTHPVKHRVQSHRNRLRAAGLKPIQIWVPDPKALGFAAECRRQSLIIQDDQAEIHDLEMLAEIADWGEE